MNLSAKPSIRLRLQGAGPGTALPYLLLAPSLLFVLAVLVYPLWDGVQASLYFYRYGKPLRFVGLDNYVELWTNPQFLNSLAVTLKFVTLSVALEAILGLPGVGAFLALELGDVQRQGGDGLALQRFRLRRAIEFCDGLNQEFVNGTMSARHRECAILSSVLTKLSENLGKAIPEAH